MKLEHAVNILRKNWENNPHRSVEETEVLAKYGSLFHPDNLENLTREDFESFLDFKNNRHWSGIHRSKNFITADPERLREALGILLDENRPIVERFNVLRPKNKPAHIKWLGRAILTPILFVVYPQKYGVYNQVAENGMNELGLYPRFSGSETLGERYDRVNQIILEIAERYELSLWQVDELWWIPGNVSEQQEDEPTSEIQEFGLEKYLEEFLVDNWESISLSDQLEIYEDDDGDFGKQYRTDVGYIDILCRDKKSGDFVVIELKKGRSRDAVLGQIQRYMGYVKEHLASGGDVRGIIIMRERDEKLEYALKVANNIELLTYKVSFSLE